MKPTKNQAATLQSPRKSQKAPTFNKDNSTQTTLLTHYMDLAQSFRVSSIEPQSPHKLDRIKKGLEEDRGYLSDGGKVSITPTSPALPPRTPRGLHPPHTSSVKRPSTSPQSSPLATRPTPPSSAIPSNGKPILFYHAHDPYYGFTNFSSDPIDYNGKKYPTSEHLFQSLKVSGFTNSIII
ncbi:hypothetical protein EV424DRAFT_254559 [Suillus variegatus]|nr:hypothetical protein EV424DRAFT_254559 [Suillus variegatus]